MKRHFITFGLLALAIGAYLLGVAKASLVLIAIGCMIEVTFWIRLFRSADQTKP
jgi:membrane protein implicated in regulation of membrane protease activity